MEQERLCPRCVKILYAWGGRWAKRGCMNPNTGHSDKNGKPYVYFALCVKYNNDGLTSWSSCGKVGNFEHFKQHSNVL